MLTFQVRCLNHDSLLSKFINRRKRLTDAELRDSDGLSKECKLVYRGDSSGFVWSTAISLFISPFALLSTLYNARDNLQLSIFTDNLPEFLMITTMLGTIYPTLITVLFTYVFRIYHNEKTGNFTVVKFAINRKWKKLVDIVPGVSRPLKFRFVNMKYFPFYKDIFIFKNSNVMIYSANFVSPSYFLKFTGRYI